jgi:hypothetical protein
MERLNLEELRENHCQGKFFDKKKEHVSKMVLKVGDIVVIRNHYFGRIEPMEFVVEEIKGDFAVVKNKHGYTTMITKGDCGSYSFNPGGGIYDFIKDEKGSYKFNDSFSEVYFDEIEGGTFKSFFFPLTDFIKKMISAQTQI